MLLFGQYLIFKKFLFTFGFKNLAYLFISLFFIIQNGLFNCGYLYE